MVGEARGSVRLEEAWPGFGCVLRDRGQGAQPVPGLGKGRVGPPEMEPEDLRV